MHNQNGVVDNDANQNNKSQNGQHIQRLKNICVQQRQTQDTARRCQGYREENDQWIEKTFEQNRHD